MDKKISFVFVGRRVVWEEEERGIWSGMLEF